MPGSSSVAKHSKLYVCREFRTDSESSVSEIVQKHRSKKFIYHDGGYYKKASWAPLLSADDDTKIVVSPYIQAPTAEAGAPRTFGGGNETLGGIEEIIGREPTPFTAVMRKMPQSLIKALKELQCESDSQNLGVYLFDENGAIGALQDLTTATTHYPIPIRSLFIGDKTLGGFEAPDSNAIQWSFLPNWSDDLVIIVPEDFNPLIDLKNAAG